MRNTTPPSDELVRRVESAPARVRPRRFTLRDDNAQHYHRQMLIIESPVYVQLAWRATAKSQVHSLGVFRLQVNRSVVSAIEADSHRIFQSRSLRTNVACG